MTSRRDLLKTAGAALVASSMQPQGVTQVPGSVLREARRQVEAGSLGPIGFCRIARTGLLPALEFVLGERVSVAELDPRVGGLVLLGAHATLVVNRRECRIFAREV